MPVPENIRLQASIGGGAQQQGAITAAHGQSVALSIVAPAGVTKAKYQIWEYPEGWTVPAGWSEDANGVFFVFTSGGAATTFNLPADPLWGKFFFSVEANDRLRLGQLAQDLYDERTAVLILSPGGLEDIGFRETTQFDPRRKWVAAMKALIRAVESATGGGGGGLNIAGAGLTESPAGTVNVVANADGSIVVATNDIRVGVINATQHGNLAGGALHSAVSNTAAGFAASISAGDRALLSNAGGTAATWAQISNAHVASDAAVAVSKLAAGTNGDVLTTVAGVPAWAAAAGGGGGFTDDGAVVRLTTAGDNVALGAAAMVGAEKLRVVGATRLEGDVTIPSTSNVILGASPALLGGRLRLTLADEIRFRNRLGTGDVVGLTLKDGGGTTGDTLVIGGDGSGNRPDTTIIDTTGGVVLRSAGGTRILSLGVGCSFTPGQSANTSPSFGFTSFAHLDLTNVERQEVLFDLAATANFVGGVGPFTQRAFRITRPTYTADSAQTMSVAATAAITGAPVASTNITATRQAALHLETGALAFGTNFAVQSAAGASEILAPHGWRIRGRNSLNTLDRDLVAWGTVTDVLEIGDGTTGVRIRGTSFSTSLYNGSTSVLSVGATGVTIDNGNILQWGAAATPVISQLNTSGTAKDFTMRAQGDTAAGNGGAFQIQGGRHTSGLRGAVRLQLNPDDSAFESMVEACEVVSGNRVLALARRAVLTSTHMGANTGDGVINIAAAATVPTSNAGDGQILYYDGAALRMRGSTSGNETLGASHDATTGHTLNLVGGNATGAGGTHNAGNVNLTAGAATGGSGTRSGGGVVITLGAGATSNGTFEVNEGGSGLNRIRVNSTGVAFNGQNPIARPDYTVTNPVVRRTFDTTTVTLQQLAEVVGTLINVDLLDYGLTQ